MHIYKSCFPPAHIPTNLSYSQLLLEQNPDNAESDKVIFEDFDSSKTISYGRIRTAAAQGAAGLKDVMGMRKGDVVAVLATNSVDWALLAHSVIWGGGIVCAINPVATAHELVHYLGVANAKIIVMEEDVVEKVQQALELSENMKTHPTLAVLGDSSKNTQFKAFPKDILNENRPPLPPLDLSNHDNRKVPAVICFSSGTSGKPKGVMLSHHNFLAYQLALRATEPFLNNGFQREVFFAPFSHIYGLIAVMNAPFFGSYVVVMKQFQFKEYIARCAKIRSTILRIVPTTAVSMAKDPFVRSLDLKSVQTVMCAGAPLQEQVVQQLQALLGSANIIQGYGLSEATVSFLRGHLSVENAGSVGQISSLGEVRIVDDDYNDVTPGQSGELLIKSPTVFMGYKDNPKETESSFRDGWFCTGDVVRVDSKGFLWLTDRKKELIKFKGNQVPPAELEDVLLSHPNVKEAAVCGVWDEAQQTEVPLGYVSLQKPASQAELPKTLQEVRDFVDSRVSPHKKLRGGVHFLEEFPKNMNGKLVRRLLPAKVEDDRRKATRAAKL